MNYYSKRSRPFGALTTGLALCVLSSPSALAVGVTLSTTSVSAAAGSSMNSFDVDLTNAGSSAFTLSGFNFKLIIANPSISFSDVTTSTAVSYVFAGDSLFGPDLSGPNSGQTITAADVVADPSTTATIAVGQTVGLGHVFFNVAPNAASGMFPLNFAPYPFTSLADSSANNVNVDVFAPGQITITGPGTITPEPSSLFLILLAFSVLTLFNRLWSTGRTLKNL